MMTIPAYNDPILGDFPAFVADWPSETIELINRRIADDRSAANTAALAEAAAIYRDPSRWMGDPRFSGGS